MRIDAAGPRSGKTKTRMAIMDPFKGFKPEDENSVRPPDVKEDETLKRLKGAFTRYLNRQRFFGYLDSRASSQFGSENYKSARDEIAAWIKRIEPRDVSNFSLALGTQIDADSPVATGIFLSALVDHCDAGEFMIITNQLDWKSLPISLGIWNSKRIVVDGSVGDRLGGGMRRGRILVRGCAGDEAGFKMKGGRIIVEEDVRARTGKLMRGGRITIKGSAMGWTGNEMQGGDISIDGDTGAALGAGMRGGEIVVRGDAGLSVGSGMEGGILRVGGEIASFGQPIAIHGDLTIYQKRKIVMERRVK